MELYHASKEIVQYPEIRKAKYTKDCKCFKRRRSAISSTN